MYTEYLVGNFETILEMTGDTESEAAKRVSVGTFLLVRQAISVPI